MPVRSVFVVTFHFTFEHQNPREKSSYTTAYDPVSFLGVFPEDWADLSKFIQSIVHSVAESVGGSSLNSSPESALSSGKTVINMQIVNQLKFAIYCQNYLISLVLR